MTSKRGCGFGAAANSDSGVGIGATDQNVALVRVAQFGTLDIAAGATITTAPWNGFVGGVIAVRARRRRSTAR